MRRDAVLAAADLLAGERVERYRGGLARAAYDPEEGTWVVTVRGRKALGWTALVEQAGLEQATRLMLRAGLSVEMASFQHAWG